jgi:predicted acylesterase/phospholipase RssA
MKGLVLDGGGVFGIGQALILAQVDVRKFDFFAGTSIGSAIAASLAFGNPSSELPKFFHEWMPKIFEGHKWRSWNICSARYPDAQLNQALQSILVGTLGSVSKPLFICAANLGSQKLKVFNSDDPDDGSWLLWEVVRTSVAGETYFVPWKGYGDGGMYANNPSMVAIAGAARRFHAKVEDLEICSIGTGSTSSNPDVMPTASWSRVRWGLWMIEALLNGAGNSMHSYFAQSLPLKKYVRIDFSREPGWEMDDPEVMLKAEKCWKSLIDDAIKVVSQF